MSISKGDKILENMAGNLLKEADVEVGKNALASAFRALQKQARALEQAEYDGIKPDAVAKALNHASKSVNNIGRFLSFATGGPDSRTGDEEMNFERALGYIAPKLDLEQLRTLDQWLKEIEANEAEGERPKH